MTNGEKEWAGEVGGDKISYLDPYILPNELFYKAVKFFEIKEPKGTSDINPVAL